MVFATLLAAWSAVLACAEPRVEFYSRASAQGEALLIVVRGLPRAPRGRFLGQPLSFVPGRNGDHLAIAGIDLEAAAGSTHLELDMLDETDTPHLWSSEVRVERKKFPTQKLQVDDRYVQLAPADERRSEQEALRLKRLFAQVSEPLLAKSRFSAPIPGALSGGRFGERRIFNDVPKSPHAGADLSAKAGTPVQAPAAGRVALAEDLFYSGLTVIVDHGLGLYTFYGHLSRIDVRAGQSLAPGETLGLVGATGRTTGPHLHWAARLQGARVDPFSLTALPLNDYL